MKLFCVWMAYSSIVAHNTYNAIYEKIKKTLKALKKASPDSQNVMWTSINETTKNIFKKG